MDEKATTRFWSKVDKNGPVPPHRPELGPCWVWTAYCIKQGYGRFRMPNSQEYAHRVSYIIQFGPIPVGACVLHECDNPPCVRHLYLGTQLSNAADRDSRGRTARRRGEQSTSTLKDALVLGIREDYANGMTQSKLAARHGITQSAVSRIVNRVSWSHL